MAAAQVLVLGLILVHAGWLWFWLCGSLALPPAKDRQRSSDALLDVVLTTGAGVAITALASFGLGLAHALYPIAALAAVPALGVALAARGDSPLRAAFWRLRFAQVRRAVTPGALIVYGIALALAPPALIPDNGTDATAFYLPQALDYARAHYLIVDQWFRYPWYPNNWTLILAWPHVLGLERYVQFLDWLCGALSLLGLYGLVAGMRVPDERGREGWVSWFGVAAAVTVATQPIFERFVAVAMLDVPTGAFFLICVAAAVVGIRDRSARVLPVLILCGGFIAGIKISYFLLLPLFCGFAAIIVTRAGGTRRTAATMMALLVLASSPWYVRSFVLAGDPIEPVLNLAVTGKDPKITKEDFQGQLSDLQTDNSPGSLIRLPYVMFAEPASRETRDIGVSLLVFCLPIAIVFVAWSFIARRRRLTPLMVVAIGILYAYAYWNLTSHLERYSLLFMPLLAAFVGMAATAVALRVRRAGYVLVPALLVLAIPSPTAFPYDVQMWDYEYQNIGRYYTDANVWLEYRAPAYWQLQNVAHLLRRAGVAAPRVYVYELGGDTYFAHQFGLEIIGDAFGLARFADLGRATDRGILGKFLAEYNVPVLIASQAQLDEDPMIAGLEPGLRSLGWRKYRYAQSDYVVFVSPALPRLVIGEGHPASAVEGRPAPATSPDPHAGGGSFVNRP